MCHTAAPGSAFAFPRSFKLSLWRHPHDEDGSQACCLATLGDMYRLNDMKQEAVTNRVKWNELGSR